LARSRGAAGNAAAGCSSPTSVRTIEFSKIDALQLNVQAAGNAPVGELFKA
jgi:hypothetical protein